MCDNAMGQIDPCWRDRYYATALDVVLAVAVKDGKQQGVVSSITKQGTDVNVLDVVKPSPAIDVSSAQSTHTDTGDNSTVSPSTVISDCSLTSQETPPSSSNSSPTTDNTEFSSVLSSPIDECTTQKADGIRCECGDIFTGDSKETNLKRHKRTHKKHQKVARYKCFGPDCEAYFSRSDNRNAHYQAHHKSEDTPPQLQSPTSSKRRRLLADDMGREPTMSAILDGRLRLSTHGLGLVGAEG